MKKDLLLSRLTKFNDKPEYFAVWQNSFTQIMDGLSVSPQDEMDLLIRWLGPDSSRQAASIHALRLPTVIECNQIPNERDEIPTPAVASHHSHLRDIAELIPPIDPGAEILLLIGRDLLAAHHVLDQRIGLMDAPYAQKFHLGWVVIGEVHLGRVYNPDFVKVNRTYLLEDVRTTTVKPRPTKECDGNLNTDTPSPQGSPTPAWNITQDTLTFQVCAESKSLTRRGVLAVINALFDPGGFISRPITAISTHPEEPTLLSPAMLLTQHHQSFMVIVYDDSPTNN